MTARRTDAASDQPTLAPDGLSLMLLISIASLYIELLLIRWVGTEVRLFAYVQNLVLITCFLGFGVGCFQSKKPGSLMKVLLILAVIALVIGAPFTPWQNLLLGLSNLLTMSSDVNLWGDQTSLPAIMHVVAIGMVAGLLWIIAQSMVPMGQWIGYCFDNAKNVTRAYTANLAGSLIGTWLLVGLAVLDLPPACWLALGFVLILLTTPRSKTNWIFGGLYLLLAVAVVQSAPQKNVYWSPYQKLEVTPLSAESEYIVAVNNVGYMSITNLTVPFLKKHPDISAHYRDSSYDSPFRFASARPNVLIVGAGAGNDAAAALRNGAVHVDAVEIDPVIYKLGRKLHPERPYDSDKVNVIINDARNFLRRSDQKYDMIIFGFLDSLTGTSGYTNMRVDNFVYSREAFEQARRLLKPEGILVLKFEVRDPWTWIGQRLHRTLTEVFERKPVTYFAPLVGHIWGGAVFIESNGKDLWKRAEKPDLAKFVAAHPPPFSLDLAEAPAPTTDDWPYVYHKYHSIPQTYLTVSAILLVIAFFMVRRVFVVRERQTWIMFSLGAGFLLMETQLITRLGLYFGNTWIINSIAVSMVLAVLVAANLYLEKSKDKDRRPVCYLILIASLIINYFLPWEQLPFSSWVVGSLLSAAYAISVLMAGIIFTTTLQKVPRKSEALGANVMGAVVGGLSQNISFIIGLKALLFPAAACYVAAAFLTLKHRK
jgi:spermidine synthase